MQKRGMLGRVAKNTNVSAGILLLALMLLLLAVISTKVLLLSRAPKIVDGQLDLSAWNLERDGIVSLNGDWGFYWQQFSTMSDQSAPDLYGRVPDVWNNYRLHGQKLPGFGYATYTLHVTGAKGTLGIKMPPCSTAYELYVDDQLIAKNGKISTQTQGFVPNYNPVIASFHPRGPDFTIRVYVANYAYARGGLWYSVFLGTPSQIEGASRQNTYREMLIIGSIATIMLFCIGTYVMALRTSSLIYFVLLSLFCIVRIMTYGDYLVIHILKSFRLAVIVEYSFIVLSMLISLFIQSLLRVQNRYFKWLCAGGTAILYAGVICTPLSFFTRFTLLFDAWAVFMPLTALLLLLRSEYRYKSFIAGGALVLIVSGISDVLYQSCVIAGSGELTPIGFYITLIFWGIALVRYYSDLIEENRASARKAQSAELAFLNAQIKPHFLYNALDAIANVCETDGERGSDLILDLAVYLRNKLEFSDLRKLVPLEREMDFVQKYFSIEQSRFGTKIRLETDMRLQPDYMLPALILQPLVENAVKHGIARKPTGGTVSVHAYPAAQGACFIVEDDGVGIAPERLPHLLEGAEVSNGSGVGILNIHQRLLYMYGRGLEITSAAGEGTQVKFFIKGEQKND